MVDRHAPEKTPTNLAAGGVPATSCRACRYAHFSVRRAVHRGLMLKNQDGRTVGACGVTRRTRSAARTESPSASPTLSSTLSRGQATAFVFGATAITASPTALPGRSKQARPARFYLNSLATLLVQRPQSDVGCVRSDLRWCPPDRSFGGIGIGLLVARRTHARAIPFGCPLPSRHGARRGP
jgi:hypothetical protein